jgi:hypothetical protein
LELIKLFKEWYGSIFFRAKGKITPKIILPDGTILKNPDVKKYDILRELLRESRIKHEDRPMILYNGTHQIKHLNKLLITDHYLSVLQNNQVAVYFLEPLTHYHPSDITHPHTIKIDNTNAELADVRCHELDSLANWATENGINDICVYCTDYKSNEFYQKLYPSLKLFTFDLWVSWYTDRIVIIEKRHPQLPLQQTLYPELITKKFWSGAWRYEAWRNFITAFLAGSGIAQKNNVSFYFKISNEQLKARLWFNWEVFNKNHPIVASTVMQGNHILQYIVPLSIEVENPLALGYKGNDPEVNSNVGYNVRVTQVPVDSYKESFCAIVQESRFSQFCPNISEKTINAMVTHRPFIMCGPPGTLRMLQEMGFQTFDKFWPEDYDMIQSNQDRLASICQTIDYVNSFKLEELKEMYAVMKPILLHNNENIKNISQFYLDSNEELMRNFQDKED